MNRHVCVFDVRLSASISQKPVVQTLNFLRMLPGPLFGPQPVALHYVMYFRFCGGRHVFPYLALWRRQRKSSRV